MAEVKIFVKIDGVEYTQDQLKDLATGSKKAADGMEDVADETKKAGDEQGFFAKKMAGVKESFGKLKAGFGDIKKGYKAMSNGLTSVAKSFGLSSVAAKVFGTTTSAAIAATGIGLIIPLVLALVNYFSNLEGGAKLMAKAMAVVGAVISNIGDVMKSVLSLDFAGAIGDATAAVDQQFAAEKKLAELQRKTIIQNAQLNASIEANKKILEDTTLSLDERLAALDGVTAATKKLAENQILETEQTLLAAQAQLTLATNYEERREKQLEIAEIQASLIDQQTQLTNVEYDAEKVAREIRTQAAAERKAAYEKRIAQQATVADALRSLNIEAIKDEQSKAEATLQVQKETALATLRENNATKAQLLQAEGLYEDQLETLRGEYADKESAKAIAAQEKKDADNQIELDKELAKQEKLKAILDDAYYLSIEDAYLRAQEELLAKQNAEELELIRLGATEEQKQKIRDKYQKIREQYAKDEVAFNKAIKKAELDAALDVAANAFSAIASLAGEQSAIGKASAVAATIINTYKAAMSAYADTPGGPIVKGIAASIAVGTGLVSIKKILSVPLPEGGGAGGGGAAAGVSNPAQQTFSGNTGSMNLGDGPSFADSNALSEMNSTSSTNEVATPIRAYVVATEMTTRQEANKKVEDISRL